MLKKDTQIITTKKKEEERVNIEAKEKYILKVVPKFQFTRLFNSKVLPFKFICMKAGKWVQQNGESLKQIWPIMRELWMFEYEINKRNCDSQIGNSVCGVDMDNFPVCHVKKHS